LTQIRSKASCYGPVRAGNFVLIIALFAVGQVSNEMFGFLGRLEHFDLSGNPGLDQSTLAGYLACTQKNLKDATRIDARGKGLKGEGSAQRPC